MQWVRKALRRARRTRPVKARPCRRRAPTRQSGGLVPARFACFRTVPACSGGRAKRRPHRFDASDLIAPTHARHAIKIAIAGASGRMGRMLIETVLKDANATLAGALDRAASTHLGQDAGAFLGHE